MEIHSSIISLNLILGWLLCRGIKCAVVNVWPHWRLERRPEPVLLSPETSSNMISSRAGGLRGLRRMGTPGWRAGASTPVGLRPTGTPRWRAGAWTPVGLRCMGTPRWRAGARRPVLRLLSKVSASEGAEGAPLPLHPAWDSIPQSSCPFSPLILWKLSGYRYKSFLCEKVNIPELKEEHEEESRRASGVRDGWASPHSTKTLGSEAPNCHPDSTTWWLDGEWVA